MAKQLQMSVHMVDDTGKEYLNTHIAVRIENDDIIDAFTYAVHMLKTSGTQRLIELNT